jgi:DNA-binding transcriptional regulator YdaS (Cro superfamily)
MAEKIGMSEPGVRQLILGTRKVPTAATLEKLRLAYSLAAAVEVKP